MLRHRTRYNRREFIVTIGELRGLFALTEGICGSDEIKKSLRQHGWSQLDAEALVETAKRAVKQVRRWPDIWAELQIVRPK